MAGLTHQKLVVDDETPTLVRDDGLRYLSKTSGSPFPNAFASGIGTMSCFFCGTHRGTTSRTTQKVMGKSRTVCRPACDRNVLARPARVSSCELSELKHGQSGAKSVDDERNK